MIETVKIVGAKPKRVRIIDKLRRRIEAAELAAALGAEPKGEYVGANLDLISLAELGTQLFNRLHSTGGRHEKEPRQIRRVTGPNPRRNDPL